MESDRNSILRIRDRERKLIFKIQEALQRLEGGEYRGLRRVWRGDRASNGSKHGR